MIDNETNDQENTDTYGEDTYTASGTLETVQENIISTEMLLFKQNLQKMREQLELTGSTVMKTEAISTKTRKKKDIWYDPLAQSFQVTEEVVYSLLVVMFISK